MSIGDRNGAAVWKKYFAIAMWLFIAAGFAVLIIHFTGEPASTSTATSKGFLRSVLDVLHVPYSEDLIASINPTARKLAHFSLFFALGFCMCAAMQYQKKLPRLPVVICAGALFAIGDEVRQYFVPGRATEWEDMLLDCAGVICGALAVTLIAHLIRRRRQRKRRTADAEAGTQGEAEADGEAGTRAESEADAEAGTQAESGADAETGTRAASEADADPGAETIEENK